MSGPSEATHSGKVFLRMPSSLHAMLAAHAEHEGVSLNQYAVAILAGGVGWKRPNPPASKVASDVEALLAAARGQVGVNALRDLD